MKRCVYFAARLTRTYKETQLDGSVVRRIASGTQAGSPVQPEKNTSSMNLFFSSIEVTRQVFYRTSSCFAIVNLKPIVPGHVLVIPTRVVSRLHDLSPTEISSLFTGVQEVGRIVERAFGADGLTVACQDGKAAGQSIPHVHIHLIPRKFHGDPYAQKNDDIYPALENAEAEIPGELLSINRPSLHEPLRVDADDQRKPRALEDMEKEAEWLKTFSDQEAMK